MREHRHTRRSRRSVCLVVTLAALASLGTACTWSRSEQGLLPRPAPATTPTSTAPSDPRSSDPRSSDPRSSADGVEIPLPAGARPTGLAAVYGSLWVTGRSSHTLYRIDPASNRVAQSVDIGQRSCGQPLAAYGDLVTLPCGGGGSVVVDGRTGAVRGTIPDTSGATAAAGAGSLWISNRSGTALRRIDPETLRTQRELRVPSGAVSFDQTFVWTAATDPDRPAGSRLAKIDPQTNRVVARHRLPAVADPAMTYAFGTLWFKPTGHPWLDRFDLATARTSRTRFDDRWPTLGDRPIAIGLGSLWLSSPTGTVVRIDPATAEVSGRYLIDARGGAGTVLVAYHSLWVADDASDTVWRVPIRARG